MKNDLEEVERLDWEKVKIPKVLNLGTVVLMIASIIWAQYFIPFNDFVNVLLHKPFLILLFPVLVIVYIFVHELIHGALMKFYSGVRPEYGFNGPFIYAKSDAFFNKTPYIILTLAPFIFWGMGIALMGWLLSVEGIWFTVFLLSINLYASRGDLQVVMLLKRQLGDLVIKDEGNLLRILKRIE